MNFKTTYTLFALLFVLMAGFGLVLYLGPTDSKAQGFVLPSMHAKDNPLNADDIDRVVIERKTPADADLVFERESPAKDWQVVEPRPLKADSGNVNALVSAIREARANEDFKPEGLKQSGLDKPSRVVVLRSRAKDREVRFNIGDVTPGKESAVVYVTSSDRPKEALAVRKSQIEAALENLAYFRSKDLWGSTAGDLRGLKLTRGKKPPVELRKVGDRWRLVQPPYGDAEAGDLTRDLPDMKVAYKDDKDNDFVADGVTDLAKYHLDPAKDELLRVEVRRGEGKEATTQTLVVGVGHKAAVKAKDKAKGKEKDKPEEPSVDKYYAYVDDEKKAKDVVKVPVSAVEPYLKVLDDPTSLRNRKLVQLDEPAAGAPDPVDAIDVVNSHGKLAFRRPPEGKGWELYKDQDKSANAVEAAEFQVLLGKLRQKNLVELPFPDPKEKDKLGLGPKDRPAATVTVWANSLEKPKAGERPEPRKGAQPAAVLRFGDLSGKRVAVERKWGTDETLVFVPDELRDLVRKGALAYLDRSLPAFNSGAAVADADVTKLVVERKGTSYEITREKSGSPWKLSKLAGRDANPDVVRDILDELNRPLKAVEVATEKASAAALDKDYGLKSAAYRVAITVTKDGKPKVTEYLFGKESSDKKGVYAKVGDKDPVYVVGKEVLNPLQEDKPLQDPKIFGFNPPDVKSLKLTGWKKSQGGSPATLVFEQPRPGEWAPKSPPTYGLDSAKVQEFVRELSNLRAERFVPSGTGLKLAEDALEVEITLAGQKEPLQLTVGGVAGSTAYYATSKQVKGEVFTVPQNPFKGPRSSLGSFAKD